MDALDLGERADVPVGSLSGGQRKRASIAVELLTDPRVFFLDEPTSGLDPATGAEFMRLLRRLADSGRTIVVTTHTVQDVGICDRVVFLARDGHLALAGSPREALEYFGVAGFDEVYERLAQEATPAVWGERFRSVDGRVPPRDADAVPVHPRGAASIAALRQWAILTRRNVDILARNKLTLAILAGSPAVIVLMFVILFRPGAFEMDSPDPSAAIMILFSIAFGGFFFGLTYGLLQIATELPIVRRERLVNLRVVPYVMSKVAVLLPLLAAVSVFMLGVLRLLDRLPLPASRSTPPSRSRCCSARRPPSRWGCSPPRRSPTPSRRRSRCRCSASPRSSSRERSSPCPSWRPPARS